MADGGHLEFQDFVTFFHLDVSSNLKLDIFRHTWQPLEFWFRGGAWEPPFSTTLLIELFLCLILCKIEKVGFGLSSY